MFGTSSVNRFSSSINRSLLSNRILVRELAIPIPDEDMVSFAGLEIAVGTKSYTAECGNVPLKSKDIGSLVTPKENLELGVPEGLVRLMFFAALATI